MNKFNFSGNLINNILIITVAFFLVSLAVIVFILWPSFQELQIVREEVRGKKIEVETKEEYFLKLGEIRTQLRGYEDDLAKINSALPNNPSLPSLFNYLQKTASASGLVLESISDFTTSPSKDFPALRETSFGIGVSGSYFSFKNFLSTLEKSARLIRVESISFSGGGEGDLFLFNLRIKVYSY